MAQKPEIQYVDQFYVHGSEARKLELRPKLQPKKEKTPQAQAAPQKQIRICVDPVALIGMVVAVVMMVALVMGAVHIRDTWNEYDVMENYLGNLKLQNLELHQEYRKGYNLEEIRSAALALGMIPAEEATVMPVRVTVPEPEAEPTIIDEMIWFLKGLFA